MQPSICTVFCIFGHQRAAPSFYLDKGSGCRRELPSRWRSDGDGAVAGVLQPCLVLQALKRWFLANPPVILTLPSVRPAAKTVALVTSRWAVSEGPGHLQPHGTDEPRGLSRMGQAGVSAGREWRCRARSDTPGQCTAPGVANGGRAAPPPCSEDSRGAGG